MSFIALPIETPKETRREALVRAAEQGLDLGEVARRTVSILLQDDFWVIISTSINYSSLFLMKGFLHRKLQISTIMRYLT